MRAAARSGRLAEEELEVLGRELRERRRLWKRGAAPTTPTHETPSDTAG